MKKTDTLETLEKTRKLLEKQWIQGAYAKDENGNKISFEDIKSHPNPISFCMLGALYRANGPGELDAISVVREILFIQKGMAIVQFNDNSDTTRVAVLSVLDEAIAKVKNEK